MDEYRKGYIYVQEQYAGVLEETDEGYTFVYDSEYLNKENAVALSLTMPLQKEKYESNVLFPFFECRIRRSPRGDCLFFYLKREKERENEQPRTRPRRA